MTGDLGDRLVETAINLLEREGLASVSLRAIAKESGVSHMAPYRHFADKDALVAAVAEKGFEKLTDAMERGSRSCGRNTGPREMLYAIGQGYIGFAQRHPGLYRLMFGTVVPDVQKYPAFADASGRAYACCVDAVAAVIAPSGRGEEDLEALTVATWSLVHGFASLLIDGRLKLTTTASARVLRDQVLRPYVQSLGQDRGG